MKLLRRFIPSPAMVVASLALLIALGGTSYAAIQNVTRNSVTTIHVKDRSLLARDFRAGQIPRGRTGPAGPVGPQGPAGPQGPPGTAAGVAVRWAIVRPDGGIAAQSGGITLAAKPSAGTYILNIGSAATGKPVLASGAYAADSSDSRGETSAGPCGGSAEGRTCPTGFDTTSHVFVQTRNDGGSPADHSFYVAIIG